MIRPKRYPDYYNKKGVNISMERWCQLLNNRKYSIIAQETLNNGLWVSTVWLGLNHSYMGGIPLIFEAMVFKPLKPPKIILKDLKITKEEIDMDRYPTLKSAKQGHKDMVAKWTS